MLLMLPRSVLVFIYLPLFVTAAPNQRRNDDDVYGGAEGGSTPVYYAQTSTPSSNGITPETTASSKLQVPDISPYSTAGGAIQEGAGNSYGGYEFGSSSIKNYPLYNSTAPYGSGSAYFPSTVSSSNAALPTYGSPQSGALSMPEQSQACPQGAGYGVATSTQTVTTIFTDTQTITTVVTSTSMVETTSTITAYATLTTSTNGQCTGSADQSPGGGLVPPNANQVSNPSTGALDQGVPGGNYPGAANSNNVVPASGEDGATMPDIAPAMTSPIQTQPMITGGYFPGQAGLGTGGLPFPSAAVPASQAYGNYSVPLSDDSSGLQASGLASVGQGGQQPYMSVGGGNPIPTDFPMTGEMPGATNPVPATSNIPVPTQQQPGVSYNVPNTDMAVPSLVSSPDYPIETQVGNPAISTGVNPYESGYQGPGLQLPSTIPPFQNMSSAAPQPMTSAPIQPYPMYTNNPGSAGISFPVTGITKTMISSYEDLPMPATTAAPLPGNGTYNPDSSYEMIPPSYNTSSTTCTTNNMTKHYDYGAHSTLLITSISNPPFIPSLSNQPQDTNVPSIPVTSEVPLPIASSSLPILPQTTFPPLNPSIPPNNLPPTQPSSIPPAQSVCTPSTSTVTASNVSLPPPSPSHPHPSPPLPNPTKPPPTVPTIPLHLPPPSPLPGPKLHNLHPHRLRPLQPPHLLQSPPHAILTQSPPTRDPLPANPPTRILPNDIHTTLFTFIVLPTPRKRVLHRQYRWCRGAKLDE